MNSNEKRIPVPDEVLKIKEEIKVFLSKTELDRELSQKICDEVFAYCKNERESIPNFHPEDNGAPHFESTRSTMQTVFNMVADENYMYHNFDSIEDYQFERYGYKAAVEEIEFAEKNGGMYFYDKDPWKEWSDNLPDYFKKICNSKEMEKLCDEFMLKANEEHLDRIIKPKKK